MKLEKQVDPLPVDSTMIIRPRSALGLKYIEITPGESDEGFAAGDTIPAAQATPEPVEIDEVFNTFDVKARRGVAAQPRRASAPRSPAAATTSTRRSSTCARC